MFKPSDPRPGRSSRALIGVLLAALLAPPLAAAGVSTLASPAEPPRHSGDFQIRCWQDGRLLFEQNGVSLPDRSQYSVQLAGSDRQGRPVYVAETRNATCLIRQAVPEHGAWPR